MMRISLIAALLLAAFSHEALCESKAEPQPAVSEAEALKDLQPILERFGGDSNETPQDRASTLRALARVREALDSWVASIPYYDKLLEANLTGEVCAMALSGAVRGRITRDENLSGARAFVTNDTAAMTARSEEMEKQVSRLNTQFERITQWFKANAAKSGPPIRQQKDEPLFWKIVPPQWVTAKSLKAPAQQTITPVLPDMQKRIQLLKQ
jgi:hypothetical protein